MNCVPMRIDDALQSRWGRAVDEVWFLKKLFWCQDDLPIMIRDETETDRSFFGGPSFRESCLKIASGELPVTHPISILYGVPDWTISHLHNSKPQGPWFHAQQLPKVLTLLARHTPSHAPRTTQQLQVMMELFDGLLLDRHCGELDEIDSYSLVALKHRYRICSTSNLMQALIQIRIDRIGWAVEHKAQPPSLDEVYGYPSIGKWLAVLSRKEVAELGDSTVTAPASFF